MRVLRREEKSGIFYGFAIVISKFKYNLIIRYLKIKVGAEIDTAC